MSQPNPNDLLTGKCPTCGRVLHLYRRDARGPGRSSLATAGYGAVYSPGGATLWEDLHSAECPGRVGGVPCKARVYLRRMDGGGA